MGSYDKSEINIMKKDTIEKHKIQMKKNKALLIIIIVYLCMLVELVHFFIQSIHEENKLQRLGKKMQLKTHIQLLKHTSTRTNYWLYRMRKMSLVNYLINEIEQ